MVVCKYWREREVPALWGGLGDSRRGETWRSERGEGGRGAVVITVEMRCRGRGYKSVGSSTLDPRFNASTPTTLTIPQTIYVCIDFFSNVPSGKTDMGFAEFLSCL